MYLSFSLIEIFRTSSCSQSGYLDPTPEARSGFRVGLSYAATVARQQHWRCLVSTVKTYHLEAARIHHLPDWSFIVRAIGKKYRWLVFHVCTALWDRA